MEDRWGSGDAGSISDHLFSPLPSPTSHSPLLSSTLRKITHKEDEDKEEEVCNGLLILIPSSLIPSPLLCIIILRISITTIIHNPKLHQILTETSSHLAHSLFISHPLLSILSFPLFSIWTLPLHFPLLLLSSSRDDV